MLPHKDKKLLDVLNNVEGIVYQAKDNRKLTPKERLQNILGVSVTIISVYPKMSDIISYSLKKLNLIHILIQLMHMLNRCMIFVIKFIN